MRLVAATVLSAAVLAGAPQTQPPDRAPVLTVSAVRHWENSDSVRIAIEISGDFEYRADRLHNPERIYFDIRNAHANIDAHSFFNTDINSALIKKIRVAEPAKGVTRVVLDLVTDVEMSASHLRNPNRLMIELRPLGKPAVPTTAEVPSSPAVPVPHVAAPSRPFTPPDIKSPVNPAPPPSISPAPQVSAYRPKVNPLKVAVPRPDPPPSQAAPPPTPGPTATSDAPVAGVAATADAKPARRTAAGTASLTRALGLKLNRVVIDPGHGGHDQGTAGPHGLLEKELVLDVSLRLGKMIEQELGAEVLYTRSDDTFVPLERRTQFANEKRADLFISVHANSSSYPAISGVETYVLNFTDNRSALDIAMRENANAQRQISDLKDMIQDISTHDKNQESREFAAKIQASLNGFESHSFPGEINRGVKQAPFVVLIGTSMPAILTEIGFVTNPKEELLLKRPDYRQKLAESIFRGVAKYNEGLSHFTVAQTTPSGN